MATPLAPAAELPAADVRRAAAGDAEACRALVELCQVRVFALASRMLVGRGRATVEDTAQDTFLHVFQRLATFDAAGPARLSTWILTICARRAIDELRRTRPTLVADLDPEDPARGNHSDRSTRRELVAALDRAVAVAEPAAQLRWDIAADGAADVIQPAGNVFYRVDHGGPLVVHTPAGDIHVTGTCFRVEVQMNKPAQMILTGAASAAIAAAVVITVYEGRVVADSRGAHTELLPGTRTVLDPGGHTLVASADPAAASAPAPALDIAHATREQLVAQLAAQDRELAALRTAAATNAPGPRGQRRDGDRDMGDGPGLTPLDQKSPDGRPWYSPSADTLAAWAKDCHVRFDEPDFAHSPGVGGPRGITADELPEYTAALADVQQQFHALVHAMYILATGDTAGADTLSLDAMTHEILDKAAPGEAQAVMQRVAQERAGLATPPSAADLAHASPVEQLIRAQLGLGDATQAAIAKVLGPDRAAAIRGDGWPRRSEVSGCPDAK